jgi:adenosylcobinamide-GDP ribazoletransferase
VVIKGFPEEISGARGFTPVFSEAAFSYNAQDWFVGEERRMPVRDGPTNGPRAGSIATQGDGAKNSPRWECAQRAARGRWRALRTAAAFLTIVPGEPGTAPGTAIQEAGEDAALDGGFLHGAMAMFPFVGAAVGALAGAVLILADGLGLPPLVAAFVALAVLVAVTGALHEDGLGDVADGFGGGRARDDKLSIMRDSRVGTYGVVAIVFSLGVRAAALAAVPAVLGAAALIAAAALSRAMLPGVLHSLPPARAAGMGAEAGRPPMQTVAVAVGIGGLIALVAVGAVTALLAVALAVLGAALVALLARRQIGGHTGDVCGAAQQTAEVAALLAIVAWR